jgi:hypothetical protein
VRTDIALCQGAKQGVDDCMNQDITITVGDLAFLTGNNDTSEDERSSRTEAVKIPAGSHSHRPACSLFASSMA